MAIYTSQAQLKKAIDELELQQEIDWSILVEEAGLSFKKFSPINLLKETVTDFVKIPDLKQRLISTGVGLVAGYLSKKVVLGEPKNPISKVIGAILQFGVSALVSKKMVNASIENEEELSEESSISEKL